MSRAARQPAPKKKTKVASAKRSRGGGGIRISTLAKKYGVDVGSSSAKPAFQAETKKETKKKKAIAAPKFKHASIAQRRALAVELRDKQNLLSSMFPEPVSRVARSLAPVEVGWGHMEPPDRIMDVWCPRCYYMLTPKEVEDGFPNNALDYRTKCPSCAHPFQTTFAFRKEQQYRFVWLCRDQTLSQYYHWQGERKLDIPDLDIAEVLMKDRPEIFFNAYRYGSKEHQDVKQRVSEFLGIGMKPMEEEEAAEKEEEEGEEEERMKLFSL